MAKKKTTRRKIGDISKQVYKFQEGITAVALELAGFKPEQVHWPPTGRPEGLTVDVDVVIGETPERAHTNISVKHWGGRKNSETAGWRMLRELIDSKVNCAKNVLIINVIFDGELKGAWEVILASFFDDYLALESCPEWGGTLVAKAYEYIRGELSGVEDEKAREILRERVEESDPRCDPDLAIAACHYSRALAAMVGKRKGGLGTFWDIIRDHACKPHPAISSKVTSLKRGLAKLLIFEKADRKKIYTWFQSSGSTEILDLPRYALELNLAEEDIGGNWYIIDPDIVRVFELLPDNSGIQFEEIFAESPVERMKELYIQPLRALQNTMAYLQYIEDNHEDLCDPDWLESLLWEVHANPNAVEGLGELELSEATNWVYKILISVLKAHGGTSQSSGFSKIGELSGLTEGISKGYISLADFVNRKPTLKITSNIEAQVRAAAETLSDGLRAINADELRTLRLDTKSKYIQRLMETGLIPYRAFDPIGLLVTKALGEAGMTYQRINGYHTAAREYSNADAGGTTKVLEVESADGPVLVLWQSPNKNARDKAKEYAARCACLIARYDEGSKEFVPRGVRVFMVIDGIWDKDDIDSLLRFGCEHVYYPDEIDQLVDKLGAGKVIPMPETDNDLPLAAEDE